MQHLDEAQELGRAGWRDRRRSSPPWRPPRRRRAACRAAPPRPCRRWPRATARSIAVDCPGHAGEHRGGGVGRAVVDEQQRHRRAPRQRVEGVFVEAALLVEARHHDDCGRFASRSPRPGAVVAAERPRAQAGERGRRPDARGEGQRRVDPRRAHQGTGRAPGRPARRRSRPAQERCRRCAVAGCARRRPASRAPGAGCGTTRRGLHAQARRLDHGADRPRRVAAEVLQERGHGPRTAPGRRGRSRGPNLPGRAMPRPPSARRRRRPRRARPRRACRTPPKTPSGRRR